MKLLWSKREVQNIHGLSRKSPKSRHSFYCIREASNPNTEHHTRSKQLSASRSSHTRHMHSAPTGNSSSRVHQQQARQAGPNMKTCMHSHRSQHNHSLIGSMGNHMAGCKSPSPHSSACRMHTAVPGWQPAGVYTWGQGS